MSGKSSTFFVLVLAALALFCFAVKSFYDYQVTKLKLEHGIEVDGQTGNQPAPAATTGSNPAAAVAAVPPPPASTAGAPSPVPATTGGTPAPTTLPPAPSAVASATDPELDRLREELAALSEENALYRERMDQRSAAASASVTATGEAAGGSPAAVPAVSAEFSAEFEQIRRASAIAKVAECNWDFDLVFIDGGTERNIKVEDKFAIRRGQDIVGWVTVEEVEDGYAVAKLTSTNRDSETARKPQPGDDVINWPLF